MPQAVALLRAMRGFKMKKDTIKERIAFVQDAMALDQKADRSLPSTQNWRLCLMAVALDEYAEESDLELLTRSMDTEKRDSLLALWKSHERASNESE